MNPAAMPNSPDRSRSAGVALPTPPATDLSPTHWCDGLPGMFFLGRTDRHRTLEIVSDGGRALLGLKSAEPFALAPLIHPDEREMVLDYLTTAVAEHRPVALEYRVRHADGGWRTVWEQSQPVQQGPQILLQGCLLDVTQRVQHEHAKLRVESERLQDQKSFALNKLAAGIAHEFNNIVAGILGSAELVSLDLPENSPARDSLKSIFEASNRARDFVYKIRALAQRPPLERQLISLAPVIEECVHILRTIFSDKVEILADLAPGCPAIHGDAAALQQTLMDICLYAWQGLPERRGRLMLSLQHHPRGLSVENGGVRPGPQLCLTVRDNGPALEKNAREKIFDPFYSRKTTGKQMGLEMFLARETVQAHQGEIRVESAAENGTVFHIYLPVAGEV